MASGLYLPNSTREALKWELAGLQHPKDGGPDSAAALQLHERLQKIDRNLHLRLDTRGSHEGRWCAYYDGPMGFMKAFVVQHADGTYKYPDPAIVNTVRDTQADPDHYAKLMKKEHDDFIRRREQKDDEWVDAIKDAAGFAKSRFLDGEKPSISVSKDLT